MDALDTNILLYAHDPRDPAKQQAATSLIANLEDGVLLWQVACEYLAASRKLEKHGLNRDKAWNSLVQLKTVWPFILPAWGTLARAESLRHKHQLSFWDSTIVAACLEAGIGQLYSEDLGPRSIEGLTCINPFAESPAI